MLSTFARGVNPSVSRVNMNIVTSIEDVRLQDEHINQDASIAQKEKAKAYNKEYREKNKEKLKLQKQQYYQANKEHLRKKQKEWDEKNPGRRKEISKKWYEDNKEKSLTRTKQWQKDNPEWANEKAAIWREKNKEKVQEISRIYRHSNRDKINQGNIKRRSLLESQSDNSINPDFVKSLFKKAKSCPYCGKTMVDTSDSRADTKTLDHLIPITKGGLHSQHNVVVCCYSCNCKKRDLSFSEWLEKIDEPYRTMAEKMYMKQHGAIPSQMVLPITFGS